MFTLSCIRRTLGRWVLLTDLNRNGDVYLFVLSLAFINSLFDMDAHSVSGSAARRVLSSVRGLGMKDPVAELKKVQEQKKIMKPEPIERKGKERVF